MSDALLRFDPAVRHLKCVGRDAVRFLNAVTTQDLLVLAPGQGTYAALTSDRGRAIADFYAFRALTGDEVVLELPDALADAAKEALERLVVADDVELTWAAGEAVGIAALDLGAAIALSGLGDAAVRGVAETALRAPRLGLDSIVVRGMNLSAEILTLRAATASEASWRSIAWGRPGAPEFALANVLNELAIEHAVSFTKGCFMGQEILNRVHTQGTLQRRLIGLEIASAAVSPAAASAADDADAWSGAGLFAEDGTAAGIVTRAAPRPASAGGGFVALAFARTGFDRAGTALVARAAGGDAREARAVVTEPPFLKGVSLEPGRDLSLQGAA